MKTLCKRATLFLTAFLLFLTGISAFGMLHSKKAEAFADEVIDYTDSIYYFSDSDPVISDEEIINEFGELRIHHNFRRLASAQEFKYLLYTGYFWRFYDSDNVTVIIQISSVTLDPKTWDNLICCLSEQTQCKPMIITNNHSCSWQNMRFCPEDQFYHFLQKPFTECLLENDMPKGNSALLVENWLAGVSGDYGNIDLGSLLYKNAPLRRLFNHMFFGADEQQAEYFDEELYGRLWKFYYVDFLEPYDSYYGFSSFSEISDISDLLKMWIEAENLTYSEFNNKFFWIVNQDTYKQFFKETVEQYYYDYGYFQNLTGYVHLFAHAEGNVYYDLLDFDDSWNAKRYTFANYKELFDFLDPEITTYNDSASDDWANNHQPITVCGIAAWHMTNEFYNLLYNAQQAARHKPSDFCWNIDDVPVYLWKVGNVIWGDGGLGVEYYEPEELTEEDRRAIMGLLAELLDFIPA